MISARAFAIVLILCGLLSSCAVLDSSNVKKTAPSEFISTPISYYSTPKAKYLGTKYKGNLDRLVEQIARNSKTAPLQFANNISSVGGIGFFTHSATKTADERYLEVVLATPETFDTKGGYNEKIHRLFSLYGFDLLNILSSDSDIYQDRELAGYGLNLAWRDVVSEPSGNRVMPARAIIYLPKEKVRRYLRDEIKQNDLLADAVIFGEEEDRPLTLVSYKPQEARADSRPAIREDNLADGNKSNPSRNGSKPPLDSTNQKPEVVKREASGHEPIVSNAPTKPSAAEGKINDQAPAAAVQTLPVSELAKGDDSSPEKTPSTNSGFVTASRPQETVSTSTSSESKNHMTSIPKSSEPKTEDSPSESVKSPVNQSIEENTTKASQVSAIQPPRPPITAGNADEARSGKAPANNLSSEDSSGVASQNLNKTGLLEESVNQESDPRRAAINTHPEAFQPVAKDLAAAKDEPVNKQTAAPKSTSAQPARESKPAVSQVPAKNLDLQASQNDVRAPQVTNTTSKKNVASISPQGEIVASGINAPASASTVPLIANDSSANVPAHVPVSSGKTPVLVPNVPSESPGTESHALPAQVSPEPTSRQKIVERKPTQGVDNASRGAVTAVPEAMRPIAEQLASIKKPTGAALESKPVIRPAAKTLEGFIIQIAFNDKDKAQHWAEAMQRRGYAVSVTEAGAEGALRVRLGNFAIRDEAERQLQNFKHDGINGIIISLPQGFQPARSSLP